MNVSRREYSKNEIRGYICFLKWNMMIDNFKIMVSLGSRWSALIELL